VAPDGGLLTKNCMPAGVPNFVTDGTDGQYYYDTLVTDLDEKGTWSWQGYLAMPTWTGWTDIDTFEVHPNLTA
jgi:hypothetical protein